MAETAYKDWVGRTQLLRDHAAATPALALARTLNRGDEFPLNAGGPLPALWNWLYFLPLAPMAEVGADGHPKRGGFLPPIDLPRRMWAGSRCGFHAPLILGDAIERLSTIEAIAEKAGKAGPMVFVTVRHRVSSGGALLIEEEQDIVYMGIPERFTPPEPMAAPAGEWSEPVSIDPVLLFRFSALTFNGHRIHYDRPYAMEVEKYPGLVVHGPLQAVLLFDAALRRGGGRTPGRFTFRGVRPLFDFEEISLRGRLAPGGGLELFTVNGEGAVGMQAALEWAADA